MNNSKAESILSYEVTSDRTPSVQYSFFTCDKIIYEYSFGFSDITKATTPDKHIVFPIFSITKTFTALSIMQLAERGLIDLNRPVSYYMPELHIGPAVTVRSLLNHTSGMPNPLPINWIHLKQEHENFDRNAFFDPVLAKNILKMKAAGAKFSYSNLGYIVLGRLIEKLTHNKYEDYVSGEILSKIDLQHDVLGFTIPAYAEYSTGYHNRRSISMLLLSILMDTSRYMGPSTGKWKPFYPVYVNGTPYGGLVADTAAMIKYARALLNKDSRLLTESYRKMMFTENILSGGRRTGMCLSWFTGSHHNQTYFTHAGGGGGFYCELRLYPGISSGSFVIFNRSGFTDERFLNRLDSYFL